jgi:hypothetical protein
MLTKAKTSVDPHKVIAAWLWLKEYNYRYWSFVIPNIDDTPPHPHIIDDKR